MIASLRHERRTTAWVFLTLMIAALIAARPLIAPAAAAATAPQGAIVLCAGSLIITVDGEADSVSVVVDTCPFATSLATPMGAPDAALSHVLKRLGRGALRSTNQRTQTGPALGYWGRAPPATSAALSIASPGPTGRSAEPRDASAWLDFKDA